MREKREDRVVEGGPLKALPVEWGFSPRQAAFAGDAGEQPPLKPNGRLEWATRRVSSRSSARLAAKMRKGGSKRRAGDMNETSERGIHLQYQEDHSRNR